MNNGSEWSKRRRQQQQQHEQQTNWREAGKKKNCWPQTKNIHRYHHNKHLLWHTIVMRARSFAPVCPIRKYHKKHIAEYNHRILLSYESREEEKQQQQKKNRLSKASIEWNSKRAQLILMCVYAYSKAFVILSPNKWKINITKTFLQHLCLSLSHLAARWIRSLVISLILAPVWKMCAVKWIDENNTA